MRRLLVAAAIVLGGLLSPVIATAAPSARAGTIVLNESGPFAFQDEVTFTTTDNLKGREYPMVYVVCTSDVTGEVLYGQLDHPNTVFVLGGGSSPWHASSDDANCKGVLYSYGGREDQVFLAETPSFFVDR